MREREGKRQREDPSLHPERIPNSVPLREDDEGGYRAGLGVFSRGRAGGRVGGGRKGRDRKRRREGSGSVGIHHLSQPGKAGRTGAGEGELVKEAK